MGKTGENAYRPCPCGSGEKYKFCCMKKDRERRREFLKDLPAVSGPDGKPIIVMDLDEGEREHERGMALVEQGRGAEAIPILERAIRAAPLIPNPYNNLALAHFLEGDVERAIEVAERVERKIDPGNVFALGNLVHFHLAVGRREEAEKIAARMQRLRPGDGFGLFKKCEALARLGRHEEVLRVSTEGLPEAGETRPEVAFFAGTAAANLGRYAEAVRNLGQAVSSRLFGPKARRYRKLIERGKGPGTLRGDWPYLDFHHWFPPTLLEKVMTDEKARRFPGLVEALVCLLNEDQGGDKGLVSVLRDIGTPEAAALLREVAFGAFGTEALRAFALAALDEMGELDGAEPVKIWKGGEWREIEAQRSEVTDDLPPAIPAHLIPAMNRMIAAMRSKEWDRAERMGRELLRKAPESPQVLHNLAAALHARGRNAEAEELLAKAMRVDAEYLFAPAGLAMIRLRQGRVQEAREALERVRIPPKAHPEACAAFLAASAETALAEGDFAAAAAAWNMAEEVAPDDRNLKQAKEKWGYRLAGLFAAMKDRLRRRWTEQRRRLLGPDASLQECLSGYSLEQLRAMAKAFDLRGFSSMRKDPLRQRIISVLRQPATTGSTVRSLPEAARRALGDVREAGGRMPYDLFTRRHGSDEADLDRWGWELPGTPLGRLKVFGLLAEGTVGGRESVLIPADLRAVVEEELASGARRPEAAPSQG